jgi:hypothetical protein
MGGVTERKIMHWRELLEAQELKKAARKQVKKEAEKAEKRSSGKEKWADDEVRAVAKRILRKNLTDDQAKARAKVYLRQIR